MVRATGFDNNDNHPQQASKEKPCLLCGGEHWCYLIRNQQGDLYKIICGHTQPGDAPEDWEHSGTARDGRPIFTKKGCRRSSNWSLD
jgi:hypothetical protein